MESITDHASLIAALGGGAEVAAGLDDVGSEIRALPVNVRAWAARNRIPPEYWPGIIAFAKAKDRTVTAEWLMNTTPARKKHEGQEPAAAAA